MSMQQIMRWGHDFLRIRGGCLTLSHCGKSMCQKKTPKNVCPFPHAFMFSSSLTFWGVVGCFLSSILHSRGALRNLNLPGFLSFTFSVVSSMCMPRKYVLVLWSEWPANNYDFLVCSSRFGSCNTPNFLSCYVCVFSLAWTGLGVGNGV